MATTTVPLMCLTTAFFFPLLQLKLEKTGAGKPSRVIHIRNIPNEVTEAEIIHLGIPFGRVTNVLVLKGKNQVSNPARPFPSRVVPLIHIQVGAHRAVAQKRT